MDRRVSAIAVAQYRPDEMVDAVREHLDCLGVWDELRPGMRVVLKPNLLARYAPERAVTTHPLMVEAVATVLRERGIDNLVLADSPGGPYTRAALQAVYRACGMEETAERCGVSLNLDPGWQALPCPEAALCRTFNVIDPVAGADYVVNLCKLKTHAMLTYSGAVKNLFGCVPGLQKPELHFRFPEIEQFSRMLVDLSLLVRPGVSLVDAVVGMEGDGPAGGDARPLGYTFAARNPHALDRALCDWIGLPAHAVGTVAHAVRDGLCPADADDIRWIGAGRPAAIRSLRMPASKPLSFGGHVPRALRRPLEWVERTLLSPRPVISRRACIGCGKCAESCAPAAVTLHGGKAAIQTERCIRCYCCHEMCPVKAVKIRRTGILKR